MSLISKYESEVQKAIGIKQSLNENGDSRKVFWLKQRNQSSNILTKYLLDQILLEILLTRDTIHTSFSESNPTPQDFLAVIKIDEKYKALFSLSIFSDQVQHLRYSLKPEVDTRLWWWFPEKLYRPSRFQKRLDWLLKSVTNVIWIIALVILINISSRIIAGNPDLLGVGAIIFNAFLVLLVSKGVLTGTNTWIEHQLDNLDIPQKYEKLIQLGLAVVILGLSITIHNDLDIISDLYFNKAELVYFYHEDRKSARDQKLNKSQLFTMNELPKQGIGVIKSQLYQKLIGHQSLNAEADYYRATKLNPLNFKAHNRLGEIYEDQGNIDNAVIAYQTAAKENLPDSLINLSRYYILKNDPNSDQLYKNYLTAIGFLTKVDKLILENSDNLELNEKYKEFILTHYNYSFHIAWTYLKIAIIGTKEEDEIYHYLNKSLNSLHQAIEHDSEEEIPRKLAYCVRAEVVDTYMKRKRPLDKTYEKLKDREKNWDDCINAISDIEGTLRPYEAAWWNHPEDETSF